jgi:hypothetical protein
MLFNVSEGCGVSIYSVKQYKEYYSPRYVKGLGNPHDWLCVSYGAWIWSVKALIKTWNGKGWDLVSQCSICLKHVWSWKSPHLTLVVRVYSCVLVFLRVVSSRVCGYRMACQIRVQGPVRDTNFTSSEPTSERNYTKKYLKFFVPTNHR